jgi:hypothetical protein
MLLNAVRRCVHWLVQKSNRKRLARLESIVINTTGNVVSGGPFFGLRLPHENFWGQHASKLLGLYEQELHETLESVIASQPDSVTNVGCAEGYYALGLSLRLPNCPTYAFDRDERAQTICKSGVELNSLTAHTFVNGCCTHANLVALVQSSEKPFLLIDCEGCERELLLGSDYPFKHARILVECHDFLDRDITRDIVAKFSKSHIVTTIKQAGRNPHAVPALTGWAEDDMWRIVSELRPETMHWLDLKPH